MNRTIAICIGALTVLGASGLIFTKPVAAAIQADSAGELYGSDFYAHYMMTWGIYDCVQARLYLDGVQKDSADYGCQNAGYVVSFNYLYQVVSKGKFTLQLWSSYNNVELYSHSWTIPTLTFAATLNPSTVTVGDVVWVGVRFDLTPGGVDQYSRQGKLTVNNGYDMTQDIAVDLYDDRDGTFWGYQARPERLTYTAGVPLSFGTSGDRTITVQYTDTIHTFSSSLPEKVTPSASETATASTITSLQGQVHDLQDRLNDTSSKLRDVQTKLNATNGRADQLSSAFQSSTVPLTYGSLALAVVAIAAAVALGRRKKSQMPPPPTGPQVGS